MPTEAIADSLPMAVGVALSPVPIAAVLTVLLSARPANAPAFLVGWIAGIVGVGAVVLLIPGLDTPRGEATPLSGWIRLALGGALLMLAARQWRQRPSTGDLVEAPKALSRLDSMSHGGAIAMGFLLSALNPKNLVLTFAGAASIDATRATPSEQAIALAVYAIVASLSVVVPIAGFFLFTERVRPALADWKEWLIHNNAGMTTTLLIVLGTLIVGSGLKIVLA